MEFRKGALLLAAGALLVISISLYSNPVHAANDPVTVTITVAFPLTGPESSAPQFDWNIGGNCAPTPAGPYASGPAETVTVDASCAYTIVSTSSTGNGTLRDLLTSSYLPYVPETSCSSGTCSAVQITAYAEEYLAVGSGCNTPVISAISPTGDRWFNLGTTLTVTCNGVWGRSGGTGSRASSWNWDGGSNTGVATTSTFVSSAMTLNSHHAFNVNVATQYQLTLDSGATHAIASITSPTITSDKYWYDSGTVVTYKAYGVFARFNGEGNRSTSWTLDSGVATALSTTANFSIAITMTSPHTVHVTTVRQWEVTLNSVAAATLNSITPPTVKNDNYWYDAGTSVTVVLNGIGNRVGGVGTRITSYTVNGGSGTPVATTGTVAVLSALLIEGEEAVSAASTTQYQISLDTGATGALLSITSTSIPGDAYWYDSGTSVTYTGHGVYGREGGTGSRVASWSWDTSTSSTPVLTTGNFSATITASAPHTLHTKVVTQYEVALTGTFGVSSATPPTVAGDDYWYDTGTLVSLSLQETFGRGAGTGWRTTSYSVNVGAPVEITNTTAPIVVLNDLSITSPQTVSVQAVRQYQLTFDQGISDSLNTVTQPTLAGDNYWYDAGSTIVVTAHGVWNRDATRGYRLSSYSINGARETTVTTAGTVTILDLSSMSAPVSITSNMTAQYLLTVTGGGGTTYSVAPPIAGDTGWYDSGTSVKVSVNSTFGSNGNMRQEISSWSLDGGPATAVGNVGVFTSSPIVMDGPHSVVLTSVTQDLVTIVVKDSTGMHTLAPMSITLTVNGGSEGASLGTLWASAGSTVSVSSVMWEGLNVAPQQSQQYTVTAPFTINLNARVYEASITVKDLFGFAVGGASTTITLANGTTVRGSTGSSGTLTIPLIPLGKYQGSVSVLGLSTSFSGDASVQNPITVGVGLSLSVVIVLVVIAAVVIVGVILILGRRRGPRL